MSELDPAAFAFPMSNTKAQLTEILTTGARELMAGAIEAELQTFLEQYADVRLQDGRRSVVRNGYLPTRNVQTAIGDLEVRVPKARDRGNSGIHFNSRLLPPYFKPTDCAKGSLPWLYLTGVCNGEFGGFLAALLGNQARLLPSKTMLLLREQWRKEQEQWHRRRLNDKRYSCWWASSVYENGRRDDGPCLLVITAATEQGGHELVAVQSGYRESTDDWEALLDDLRERGLEGAPELAIGDSAMAFWNALTRLYPACRHQYCWVHKAAEVADRMPEPMWPVVKKALHQTWLATTRAEAHAIFDRTLERLSSKCGKCSKCSLALENLAKDRNELLAFYDFPADRWGGFRRPALLQQTSSRPGHTGCNNEGTSPRPQTWLWPIIKKS